ncbi:hypothetical protein Har1130_03730 [Haloarcula sp. CBA1130]|uniref:hypothetical protein n=1 Tax=unclassified Haloarcula TaxID=2624677 RepID=UPI0012459A77|nr:MULTISPECIES: hypothetical protein [unclassified Haloarcula]KAA9398511.1 hypothetical protein Har1129_09925 [Haloarcula sp. CBA1129]KAA9401897.1 hypothetical protein Har1130_03730 [Haloarcula sp. CBA1130]
MGDQYKIEWLLDTDEKLSSEESEQLVQELAEEIDAEDEVEFGGQVIRKSVTEVASVGILIVSSISTLIQVYQFLQDRDDSNVGVRQVNNEMFYVDEVNPTVIEDNGGTVIANVEGDVYFFTLPEDMDQHVELMAELRESEEESGEEQN